MPSIDTRQLQLPPCVIGCVGNVDVGSCADPLDWGCICTSASYQADLADCFDSLCSATDAQTGLLFGQERCAAAGFTLSESLPSSTGIAPSGSTSVAASLTSSVEITGTPSSWVQPPVLYKQTLVNVQAIMSSICLALLLAAVALGVLSCRARIKRERGQTASQWSGAGTFGDQTKFDGAASRFGAVSRPGPSSQTETYMSGVSDFRQTVSFGSTTHHLPYDRPKFTNRMTVEEEEEWEMKDRAEGVIEEVPTPTTANSGMNQDQDQEKKSVEGEGDERDGSQVALNQVNELDKQGRAI